MVNLAKKKNDTENVKKISALEKMHKQIMEKSGKMKIKLCQLLVLRQYLLFTIENMDDEQLKNSLELQNLIRQFSLIDKSNMLYDQGFFPISWCKILIFFF